MQNKISELENAARLLNLPYEILSKTAGEKIIADIFKKFRPDKITGHLVIGSNTSVKLKTEDNEFIFSKDFKKEPIYVFFEQDDIHKGNIFVLHDGKELSNLLEECFGMEYFISNHDYTFLISVNWYTIEICHAL